MDNNLDTRHFFPEVFQVVPGEDYAVYAYMNDGAVRLFNAKPLIDKGGVFEPLKDKELFHKALTVIGNTVAWDLEGNRDEYRCIDIDPFEIYESPIVTDVPSV